ncbi:MAG: MerR family transcriptional regulator [Alphaproteobacteria bacterium]|nr:MerR family transcriptional regulator [Alphaproteobacteria bacterium]
MPTPKTILYCENIGLVRPGRRTTGYRDYATPDVHKLAFLQRARSLGVSIEDCCGRCVWAITCAWSTR